MKRAAPATPRGASQVQSIGSPAGTTAARRSVDNCAGAGMVVDNSASASNAADQPALADMAAGKPT